MSARDEIAKALMEQMNAEYGEEGWDDLRSLVRITDALLASPAFADLIREARADLQARLNAIHTYANHPGHWGTLDGRARLLRDLTTGALDPTTRDWGTDDLQEITTTHPCNCGDRTLTTTDTQLRAGGQTHTTTDCVFPPEYWSVRSFETADGTRKWAAFVQRDGIDQRSTHHTNWRAAHDHATTQARRAPDRRRA